ncbi:uncharacterized protein LOC103512942 isoform X4 [Diaphorina citri]|uniref:Uncharacterized protein LOC103512942 isoform X4 n=1 Tax=Diaphorina citri TaxID=121845 RepID=A0A1S3D7B2_DIACI|nr:uncharacterized protein LOC103512942 isoform X4 [Diaphorina citri]
MVSRCLLVSLFILYGVLSTHQAVIGVARSDHKDVKRELAEVAPVSDETIADQTEEVAEDASNMMDSFKGILKGIGKGVTKMVRDAEIGMKRGFLDAKEELYSTIQSQK